MLGEVTGLRITIRLPNVIPFFSENTGNQVAAVTGDTALRGAPPFRVMTSVMVATPRQQAS